jgi:hypothetical protein
MVSVSTCTLCTLYPRLPHLHTDDQSWVFPSASRPGERFHHTRVDRNYENWSWTWSCDCEWGQRDDAVTMCWHAGVAQIWTDYFLTACREGYPEPDKTEVICSYLRIVNGEAEDQLKVLLYTLTQARISNKQYLARALQALIAKWASATAYPHDPEPTPPVPPPARSQPAGRNVCPHCHSPLTLYDWADSTVWLCPNKCEAAPCDRCEPRPGALMKCSCDRGWVTLDEGLLTPCPECYDGFLASLDVNYELQNREDRSDVEREDPYLPAA